MNDSISRHAAIEAVQNRRFTLSKEKVLLINDLEKLPSAQPYTIHSDGRLWVTVDDIDKVTAVVVDEHKSKFCKQFYEDYEDAQPERIKGRWEQDGHHIKCDQCGEWMCDRDREGWNFPKNYCPNCGAEMEVTT